MGYQTYRLTWRGIEIEARYDPDWGADNIAHLEIESINPNRSRLPMTNTGYRSHFHPIGFIEAEHGGDVVTAVINWLDNEAASKAWKKYVEESQQLTLF